MSDLAKVGDRIEHGEAIPANVVRMTDSANRADPDAWHWFRYDGGWRMGTSGRDASLGPLRTLDQLRGTFYSRWPMTVVEVDPEPLPAEDDEPVHYVVPEFGPSGATLCGLGIEEDSDLLTTGKAGKGTCRDCRIAVDEEPAEPVEISQHCNGCGNRMPPPAVHKATCPIPSAVERLLTGEPAESNPLVLTLPVVPDGAVALVTSDDDGRLVRFMRHGDGWAREGWTPAASWTLPDILRVFDGRVTVEMAPPREPRTWPAHGTTHYPEGSLPQYVEVDGWGTYGRREDGLYANTDGYPDDVWRGHCLTFDALRALGKVREVLT